MNTLQYKNFTGTFNYVEDEDILFGKIEGIDDLVTFQGESISEIKQAFREAVEDYIFLCKETGKEAYKSFKGSFNVRIAPELHRAVFIQALKNNTNINGFVQNALEQAVNANH